MTASELFLGIDFGTSGVRVSAINLNRQRVCTESVRVDSLPTEAVDPESWLVGMECVLQRLWRHVDPEQVAAVCCDGTSGSVLAVNDRGEPASDALMYNDRRAVAEAEQIRIVGPSSSAAHGVGSSLAKALWLQANHQLPPNHRFVHQADWIAMVLSGVGPTSDENNALKMGYEPTRRCWPDWLEDVGILHAKLPRVVPPGSVISTISERATARFGFSRHTEVRAGTTDSVAGAIASGVSRVGEAITALGSTMVLKVMADRPVFAPEFGVYSHRLGDQWLVGGASNSGGAVLKMLFCHGELQELSDQIDPSVASPLDYYPLIVPGERFPVNNPDLSPRLEPRPTSERDFLHGVLEGIARIEQQGYERLAELGAPYPTRVVTNGGGAKNRVWSQIRARRLGVPVVRAEFEEASYGAALLALGQGGFQVR